MPYRAVITLILLIIVTMQLKVSYLSESSSPKKVYVVITSRSTLEDPNWKKVVNALVNKYNAYLLIYENDIYEVRLKVAELAPDFICFVVRPNYAKPEFVKRVNRFIRELDEDPYPDSLWAILTGYTWRDALRIIMCKGFKVRRVLSGCSAGWLKYVKEGIATSEVKYGEMWIKYPNGTIVKTKGPEDRTLYLASLINTNRFDMFITSGHGNHDRWQLHYPDPGKEGFFISRKGCIYATAHNMSALLLNSSNPKIYFGLGNCYIGSIINENSMPLAWIHSCNAHFYTGYVIEEGADSYMMGGIPAYFFVQDNCTWAEAFFANAVSLVFDMNHGTPGPNPSWLKVDIDGAALYGEPALEVRAEHTIKPLYTKYVNYKPLGNGLYNVIVKIKMNRDGTPGWNGKWGNRHPVIILPMRVENVTIISTNAYKAIVADNFVLLYVWKKGDPPLKAHEERFVIFRANLMKRPRKVLFKESMPLLNYKYLIIVILTLIGLLITLLKFKLKQIRHKK